jgi:hypothetical protein
MFRVEKRCNPKTNNNYTRIEDDVTTKIGAIEDFPKSK